MWRKRWQTGLRQRCRTCVGTLLITFVLMSVYDIAAAQLNCNVGVEFYPDGGIKGCNLNGAHRIYTAQGQAVSCADGHVAMLFPDGRLKSCTLAATFAQDPLQCATRSRIEFRHDGTMSKCEQR